MKKCLWLIILLLLVPLCACGETIIVAPGEGTLTAALADCADGDVILLEDGVFGAEEENFPLTVTRSVTIRAAEDAHPVIDAPAMKAAIRIEADGVTLGGLDIRFRRTGIYSIGNDMTLEQCRISLADENWRVTSCGIWCGGICRMTLNGCAFTGCGVSMAGPPLTERSENLPKLTGLFEVGEDAEYFTSHTIENCTVNGKPLFYASSLPSVTAPADAGEIICCGCGEVVVRNAEITDCSMGIILDYDENITVENCRADRCGVFGIYVAKCSGGTVRGCSAEGTNHAIDIRADRNILLENCTAESCEQGMFFSSVTDSIMKDCTVKNTRQGFFMAAGSGNVMTGCAASECENGYHLQKEENVLINACTAEKCTVCGVRLYSTPALCIHNTLKDNWTAVMAYGGAAVTIADNLFTGNQCCGLYLTDIGSSRIIGNRFEGSGQSSVIVSGTVENTLWSGNTTDIPADLSGMTDSFAWTEND